MTKTIILTQGKVAIVDDEDYPELAKHKWYAYRDDHRYYAGRMGPRGGETHARIRLCMHSVITIPPEGMVTDHINGNGLDNRRENLRVVTTRENTQNRHGVRQIKTSKHPGVSWDSGRKKWVAQIYSSGKNHYLGRYPDEETAGIVYAMACNALKMGVAL